MDPARKTIKLKLVTDPERFWQCAQTRKNSPMQAAFMQMPHYQEPEIEVYLPPSTSCADYECNSKYFFNVVRTDPNNLTGKTNQWVCTHIVEYEEPVPEPAKVGGRKRQIVLED